jgi:hypothetical protein
MRCGCPHLDGHLWQVVWGPELGGDVQPELGAVLQGGVAQPDAVDTTLCTQNSMFALQWHKSGGCSGTQQTQPLATQAVVNTVAVDLCAVVCKRCRAAHLLEHGLEQQRLQQWVQLLANVLDERREAKLDGVLQLPDRVCGVA